MQPGELIEAGVCLFEGKEMFLFALMSPVLAVSNVTTSRRREAKRSARDSERFDVSTRRRRLGSTSGGQEEVRSAAVGNDKMTREERVK